MTAAISAMGRSSRPQPRARMCPRRPAGRGFAFLISRTRANAMLPSSSSDTRYAKLIAEGSSRSKPRSLSSRARRGRAMGLRPGSGVGLSPLSGQAGQPAQGFGQHLGLLAEGEADVTAGRFGVVVEDGGRDGDHARAVGQGPAELHAVGVAQGLYVSGDEVGALRLVDLEADLAQPGAEQVALGHQVAAEPGIVLVRQGERLGHRVLERAAADEREELLGRLHRGHQLGRGLDPADLPAGEGERLTRRTDRHGALAHPGELDDRHVLAVEDEVLVDLVGDHEQVALDGQSRDGGEFVAGEHRAGGVVRAVEQDEAGAGRDGFGEFGQVGAEARRAQRDRDADAAGHGDVGRVGVVVGLERDHLVARLDQREHGRRDRLGGAGGNQDLAVRVIPEAVEPLVVRCDGLAQLRHTGAWRVLVAAAGQDRVGRDLGDLGRPVPVGETLAQVDGPGDQGARGHLGEDRGAEALQAPVQQWSAHEPNDITRSQVRLQGMRVALCQIPVSSRAEVNSGRVRDAMAEAADKGADLAVFPEATQVRFGSDLRTAAEPLDGPFCSGLAAAAKQTGVALVAGVFEPAPGGRVYNTAVAYDGTGELVTAYRKLHLFDAFGHRESDEVAPGSAPVACTVAGVRAGLAICYDVRFGELSRALAVAGAELLVLPAAWAAGLFKEEHWVTLVRARAIENTMWVAAVCQVPDPDEPPTKAATGVGRSMLVDPLGVVRADLGPAPGVTVAEVDTGLIATVRASLPSLANRRDDVFGPPPPVSGL